jgi:predicted phosphodiesterase
VGAWHALGVSTGFALIADVHGNSWALEAVVSDARRSGVTRFLDLGDRAYGPLDPAGTMALLATLDVLAIAGNEDRVDLDSATDPTARFMRSTLDRDQREQLLTLTPTAAVDGVLLCHGTPADDTQYLLEEVTAHGRRTRAPAAVAELLRGVDAELVLCAHTHIPRLLRLADGRTVVNPGSVGLPAYDDDVPHPHVMESGSPHARYALLRHSDGAWNCELRAVDYPWHHAADAARQRGREDWAVALESGLALPTIQRGADDLL